MNEVGLFLCQSRDARNKHCYQTVVKVNILLRWGGGVNTK